MREPPEGFVAYLIDFERLAPSTVRRWSGGVASLFGFVKDPHRAAVGEISVADLRQWLAAAEERGLSTSTQQALWYSVRAYYRWLEHEGYRGPSPLVQVRPPRVRYAPRRDYSAEDVSAIFEAAQGRARSGEWRDVFNLTVLAVLRFTGARSAEVAGVRRSELDLVRRNLSVLGKGNKRRSVPLPHPLVVVLDRYLTDVHPHLPASSFLFPTLRSGGAPAGRDLSVSTHLLRQVVARFGEDAGVAGPHHPHRWRHTYATHLLRSGVDVVVVRDLMGHASVVTTSIYLHLLREDMRDGVDRAFA